MLGVLSAVQVLNPLIRLTELAVLNFDVTNRAHQSTNQ